MINTDFTVQAKKLIDNLKNVCAAFGLGNDGNEYKIITQAFLFKFLNDKFSLEMQRLFAADSAGADWEARFEALSESEQSRTLMKLPPGVAKFKINETLSNLFNNQNVAGFAEQFDRTLVSISERNAPIFSVSTASKAKIVLFEPISQHIADADQRDGFCRAIINNLVNFHFQNVFLEKFDFFSTIFEYMISDYNKDGGGKYAEYYTPHAVAKIMAKILVDKASSNSSIYDPSAGSGTLLMNVAHELGEENCSIYSQDISQKSSNLLRLNLILNDLVHSIPNVIQGNTLTDPYHLQDGGLATFDYIVSNPPFKLDFSEYREDLASPKNSARFWAGVPKVPAKKKDSMAIYLVFIQHIINSLNSHGKAAVVVPTGFLASQDGIAESIRRQLIEEKALAGVVSMPSNIFANTGTSVSILVIDRSVTHEDVLMVDASNLGTNYRIGKSNKTVLSTDEEDSIIFAFRNKTELAEFSTVVKVNDISERYLSFAPAQYFPVRIQAKPVTKSEISSELRLLKESFSDDRNKIAAFQANLEQAISDLGY